MEVHLWEETAKPHGECEGRLENCKWRIEERKYIDAWFRIYAMLQNEGLSPEECGNLLVNLRHLQRQAINTCPLKDRTLYRRVHYKMKQALKKVDGCSPLKDSGRGDSLLTMPSVLDTSFRSAFSSSHQMSLTSKDPTDHNNMRVVVSHAAPPSHAFMSAHIKRICDGCNFFKSAVLLCVFAVLFYTCFGHLPAVSTSVSFSSPPPI